MSSPDQALTQIDPELLAAVAGGKKTDDAQLQQLLTSITSSIKDLANQQNKGTDPMQLMLMMLMLGGGGGGGGGVVGAAPAVAGPPVINVSAAVGGCRGKRKGKKGW